MKRHSEPRPLQLSKRANVFYLEHARVVQQDDRIVYLTQDGGEFEQMFNIPERNTAFLLLGKGTSITDAAMRRMAASNVMVGFCGTGGSPLFSVCDIAFMTPQSEYRPTEYMQAWAEMWFDPARRLEKARSFLRRRAQMTAECWRENSYLQSLTGNGGSLRLSTPATSGYYHIVATYSEGGLSDSAELEGIRYDSGMLSLDDEQNWILTRTFNYDNHGDAKEEQITYDVSYYDGLGYASQNVQIYASGDEQQNITERNMNWKRLLPVHMFIPNTNLRH